GYGLVKRFGTTEQILSFTIELAALYIENGNTETALSLLEQSLKRTNDTDCITRGNIYLKIGKCYIDIHKYDEASASLFEAYTLFIKCGDVQSELHTIKLIAEILNNKEEYLQVIELLSAALPRCNTPEMQACRITMLTLYGKALLKTGKEECFDVLQQSLTLCISHNPKNQLLQIYVLLAEYYEWKQEYQKAFQQTKSYNLLKDELEKANTKRRINIMQSMFKYELLQHKQEMLEKQSELNKQEREYLLSQLDMSNKSMLIQTEELSKLRNEILTLTQQSDKPENILQKVRSHLLDSPVMQATWDNYLESFASVHPNFEKQLRNTFPTLTKMEVRICILIDAGMDTEQISKLLSLSHRSVENHRLRIRKKLGVERGGTIQALLATL
ncbi:MAG: hypothetical protein JNJ85_12760, partial [Candidatus Kapabacteria bacterium]|nr:hypothetical protein [Candidatus Kapabacteria bacterium]